MDTTINWLQSQPNIKRSELLVSPAEGAGTEKDYANGLMCDGSRAA